MCSDLIFEVRLYSEFHDENDGPPQLDHASQISNILTLEKKMNPLNFTLFRTERFTNLNNLTDIYENCSWKCFLKDST